MPDESNQMPELCNAVHPNLFVICFKDRDHDGKHRSSGLTGEKEWDDNRV